MNQVHYVILAGGSGQRLWPLSTKKCPKHLIPFLNNKSLLEQTIERVSSSEKNQKIWILTNQDQFDLVKKHVNHLDVTVVAEPTARNTAPAVLWMCNKINEINSNAVITILPADHFIPEKEIFKQAIEHAITFARNNSKIVTLGIKPKTPATGYGYIQADISKTQNILPAIKFHEKPDFIKANEYLKQCDMFWNAGIFIGTVATFLSEFKIHSQTLFNNMQDFLDNKINYSALENISIDYAIMEKSSNIVLIPADFEWHDVGNLSVFLNLKKRFEGNLLEIINLEAHNNLASTNKKLVVCIGVSELCIIETENVILIAKNEHTELVKNIIPKIKNFDENVL